MATMPPSDLEIQRLAHHLIQRYSEKATAKARRKVTQMRYTGSKAGTDMWLRVIAAIGDLGEPPPQAQH